MVAGRVDLSLTFDLFANMPAPSRRACFVANRLLSERAPGSSGGANFFVNTLA